MSIIFRTFASLFREGEAVNIIINTFGVPHVVNCQLEIDN